MRAAIVQALDGPTAVNVVEVERPVPASGQVEIAVEFAALSYPDVLLSRGLYQMAADPPFTLGWQVSGRVVEENGEAGARVAALTELGGLAERVVVDPWKVLPLPESLDLRHAAAMPLNYLSAHIALVARGELRPTDTVLVHGAGGGLGGACCSVAASLGARVIGVASTTWKRAAATAAGATEVTSPTTFLTDVRRFTDGRGVDMVVDPVGGNRFLDSLRSLAPTGRMLVMGFASGEIPSVRVNRLLLTNTSVVGVGAKELWDRDHDLPDQHWQALMQLHGTGMALPVVAREMDLADVAIGLIALETRGVAGNVIVRMR